MKENFDISPENMKEAMAFAKSDAGRQLYELLQRTQGQQLQSAMDQAATGNYEEVKRTLASMLADPETKRLLRKMGK
jgi:hypothetical protein